MSENVHTLAEESSPVVSPIQRVGSSSQVPLHAKSEKSSTSSASDMHGLKDTVKTIPSFILLNELRDRGHLTVRNSHNVSAPTGRRDAEELRKIRKGLRLSQGPMAALLGVSQAMLSYCERGRRPRACHRLLQVAQEMMKARAV